MLLSTFVIERGLIFHKQANLNLVISLLLSSVLVCVVACSLTWTHLILGTKFIMVGLSTQYWKYNALKPKSRFLEIAQNGLENL